MSTIRTLNRPHRPVLAWVPVTDAEGRTRMEMRWTPSAGRIPRRAAAA